MQYQAHHTRRARLFSLRHRNEDGISGQEGVPVLWRAAAACFIVAAAVGVFLRFGFVTGLPWGLQAGNVRHAHSHLMSFSWTTPAMIALWLSSHGSPHDPRHRLGWRAGLAALILGSLTFPFFLIAGYGRVEFLGAALPYASMLSGVTMIAWYAFSLWRLRNGRLSRDGDGGLGSGRFLSGGSAAHLLDTALIALLLSTVGAWARAALQASGSGPSLLADLAVQFFLGAFMHGWLIVGTLGLAYGCLERGKTKVDKEIEPTALSRLARIALLLGMPGVSLSGMMGMATPAGQAGGHGVGPAALAIGLGTLVFALGLLWYAWRFTRIAVACRRWEWLPFIGFLTLVIVGLVGLSIPAVAQWGERAGLRILYLHALTLGVASAGLITAARNHWGADAGPSPWSFGASTLVLLVGLLSLTQLWPKSMSAQWRLSFAAWTSIPPVLMAIQSVWPLTPILGSFSLRPTSSGGSRRGPRQNGSRPNRPPALFR